MYAKQQAFQYDAVPFYHNADFNIYFLEESLSFIYAYLETAYIFQNV